MKTIFFTYFSLLIAILILLYAFGALLFKLLKIEVQNSYVGIFAKMLVALTLFVVGAAVYFTKGITVLIILLPILACLFWRFKIQKQQIPSNIAAPKLNIAALVSLFFGVLIVFGWRFYQIYNPNGNLPMPPHGDVVFYSNLIDFLIKFGYENSSIDYIKPIGTSPYHYFELWLGALITNVSGLNTGLTLILEVFCIGPVMIWFGLCALLSQFKNLTVIDIFFCLCGVFITGIAFDFYSNVNFMENIGVYTCNAINYNKLFPIYLFSISAILFFINKKNTEAVICLMALPVVFVSTAIGLFSALFIWLGIDFIRTKKLDITSIIVILFVAFCIFLFYKVTPAMHTHVSTNFSSTISKLTDFHFVKTSFNIVAGTTLQFIILFLPFLILFFITGKLKISDILFNSMFHLVILIYTLSLIGWALLHDSTSTTQVFANITVVMLNIIVFYVLCIVWSGANKFKWLAVLFIGFTFFIGIKNSISGTGSKICYLQKNEYLNKIYDESQNLSLCGSFVYSTEDYKNSSFGYIANFSKPGDYLIYAKKKTFPLSISPFNYVLSEDKDQAEKEYASLVNTPFWRYVDEQKSNKTFESLEKSQLQFIDEHKINYLICTKNVTLSNLLQQKIEKAIIDENTGERFYILK